MKEAWEILKTLLNVRMILFVLGMTICFLSGFNFSAHPAAAVIGDFIACMIVLRMDRIEE